MDGRLIIQGNEEIAGVKTFLNGVYQKSTLDIGVAVYNSKTINRLYDVNNVVLFEDAITTQTNNATNRSTFLANKDVNGDYFSVSRNEFVDQ